MPVWPWFLAAERGKPWPRTFSATSALGLATAVSAAEPVLLLPRRPARHADRRAAGHRAGRDHRHAAADHLRAGADRGSHHAGRHLLRRAVRRLDHGDPRQSAGRGVLGRDVPRRLPDGASGTRGPSAGDRGHRLVLRGHGRHADLRTAGCTPCQGCRAVRSGRILLADGARPHRRGRDRQSLGAEGDRHGDRGADPRPRRHRREHRRRSASPSA